MTPRFWHVQLLSLFLVPACVDLRAQVLPIRTYATADGLAHNTVNRIVAHVLFDYPLDSVLVD